MDLSSDKPTATDQRIAELEDLLVETERQLILLHRGEATTHGPPPPPPPPAPPAPPPATSMDAASSAQPGSSLNAELLLRLAGIAMVIASAVFFVSTAISRGWIGPSAQLAAATLASLAMIASSFRFAETRRPWAITMATGGAASLFVSGVVGFVGLDLLSFPIAAGWLVVSVASFLVLARLHDAESIAVLSVPAAIAGIVLLRLGSWYDPALLSAFGAIYLLGVTTTTHSRSWFWARTFGSIVGAFVTGIGVLASLSEDFSDTGLVGLLILSVVAILLAASSQAIDFAAVEAAEHPDPAAILEARFAAATIPWISALIAAVVTDLGLVPVDFFWVLAALGLGCGILAAALPKMALSMRLLHVAAAIGTTAVALVAVSDGPVLLVALLVQALIAGGLAYRFRTLDMVVLASLLATAVAALTAREILNGAVINGLSIAESLSVLLVVAASGVVAWLVRRDGHLDSGWVVTWLLSLGWASATFRDIPQGQMVITLVWAGIGVAMVVAGSRLLDSAVVHGGFATLAVTAGKLIFIDLVAVDVLWRAGLFFAVGSLFLRLAFMLPQLTKDRSSDNSDDIDGDGTPTEPLVGSGVGGS